MAEKWTTKQLNKLRKIATDRPAHVTEFELARHLSGQFKKSPEAIRWQLRQFRHRETHDTPKILVLDIETLPIEALLFRTRKVYVSSHQVKKDWSILSWSAKWLFDKTVHGQVVSPQEAVDRKDDSVLPKIWEMMNDAHAIITYNGNGFDLKRLNTRFLLAGMPRPMYSKSIDLFRTIVDNFDFTFSSMDYVNSVLGIGRKVDTAFHWWDKCSQGNKTYLNKMLEYNKIDVNITEELYVRLRPWITNGLNLNLFTVDGDIDRCGMCSSPNLEWGGAYSTALALYKGFRCQDCGSIGRSTRKQYKLSGSRVRN